MAPIVKDMTSSTSSSAFSKSSQDSVLADHSSSQDHLIMDLHRQDSFFRDAEENFQKRVQEMSERSFEVQKRFQENMNQMFNDSLCSSNNLSDFNDTFNHSLTNGVINSDNRFSHNAIQDNQDLSVKEDEHCFKVN